MNVKILVVDDTILFRRILSEAIAKIDGAEVIGTAANGRAALAKINELKPDLLTLDIEMPGMSGIEVLDEMKKEGMVCGAIVVSALTTKGGKLTMQALEKGAFDFVTKPEGESIEESRNALVKSLTPLIKAFSRRLEIRNLLNTGSKSSGVPKVGETSPKNFLAATPVLSDNMEAVSPVKCGKPEMILIGVSTGGPNALGEMLPMLPSDLGVPVFIVQHMPPMFTQPLAESLNSRCHLIVKEAEHGETAKPGHAYIAPGGKHLRLRSFNGSIRMETTDDPPENNCRPAVDFLFRSAAHQFPGKSLAVIMTGMGSDGLLGVRLLKRHGCFTIAQDEATCVVYGMPKAIVDADLADSVQPLKAIAGKISMALRGR